MKNKVLIEVEIIDIIKFQKMFDQVLNGAEDFNINGCKITKIHNFEIIKNKNDG